MAERDLLAVALVALVALSGLVLGGGSQGAVVSAEQFGVQRDGELGWSLGEQAVELARASNEDQNRVCSLACMDLCPASVGWQPTQYQTTPEPDCVDWCKIRCERVLQAGYEYNYGRN